MTENLAERIWLEAYKSKNHIEAEKVIASALRKKEERIKELEKIKQCDRCFKIGVEDKAHTCKIHEVRKENERLKDSLQKSAEHIEELIEENAGLKTSLRIAEKAMEEIMSEEYDIPMGGWIYGCGCQHYREPLKHTCKVNSALHRIRGVK